MTQEALKKMYQMLLTEPHAPTVCAKLERIAREALAEHAMQEVQRLGQEIEQELSNGLAMALHDAVLIRIGKDDEATRQAIARIDKLVAKYEIEAAHGIKE